MSSIKDPRFQQKKRKIGLQGKIIEEEELND